MADQCGAFLPTKIGQRTICGLPEAHPVHDGASFEAIGHSFALWQCFKCGVAEGPQRPLYAAAEAPPRLLRDDEPVELPPPPQLAGWQCGACGHEHWTPPPCCLKNTHTTHYSDGYKVECKVHGTKQITDTGWNR